MFFETDVRWSCELCTFVFENMATLFESKNYSEHKKASTTDFLDVSKYFEVRKRSNFEFGTEVDDFSSQDFHVNIGTKQGN